MQGRVVAACSALKRGYRERLREAIGGSVNFILLDASADELQRRLRQRSDHYMPVSLLKSQLATLELPHADEGIVTLDAALPPEQLSALVQTQLDTRIRTIGAARR
jgi:gluconokinase